MAKPIPEGYHALTTYLVCRGPGAVDAGVWSVATHIEDVPPEEMAERARAAMAAMGSS
jgi:hypothetical protein